MRVRFDLSEPALVGSFFGRSPFSEQTGNDAVAGWLTLPVRYGCWLRLDVVGEPARADNPCHHGAGMQAHPDRERGRQPRPQSPGCSNHVESKFRRHPGVIGAWRGYAGDRHVVVADRLYLFDFDVFGKLVEFSEQFIESGADLRRVYARR